MKMDAIIDELQNKLEEIDINDFCIIRFDRSGKLLLAGSFDFCYYHEVEIVFS